MQMQDKIKRNRTPFELCVLMGIWPLFNPDTFRSSGLHFGKKKMVIHYHYGYIIQALREMAPRYIKWPDAYEREIIKAEFEDKYGYAGAVGCMDGVNIDVTAPLEQAQRYVNRHDRYSVLVQAVCDHRLLYRDVYAGEAGCIGDVRNFDRSPLSLNLLTSPDLLSEGEHILADGAYTLTDKVQNFSLALLHCYFLSAHAGRGNAVLFFRLLFPMPMMDTSQEGRGHTTICCLHAGQKLKTAFASCEAKTDV